MVHEPGSREEAFLRQKFREYYSKNQVYELPKVNEREFGYGTFERKIVNRHLQFDSQQLLQDFLAREGPLHVSASVACYENAKARTMKEMKLKHFDVIFEFDADAIPTDCKKNHDSWKCSKCPSNGKGLKELCSDCGSKTVESKWVCDKCLDATRFESQKLIKEFLFDDFGFNESEVYTNFSGNRGFHVYTRSTRLERVGKEGLLEMLDYVQGVNLDPELHGFRAIKEKKGQVLRGPKASDFGWPGRLARSAKEYFAQISPERLSEDFKLSMPDAKKVLADRESVLNGIDEGFWDQVSFGKSKEAKEIPARFWAEAAKKFAVQGGADVDVQSSVDVHKIMRVPGSLHGSSGLVGRVFPLKELDTIDPLRECVVFSDKPVKVKVSNAPRFSLKGESFGPFEDQEVELPEYAAVYLIARKAALLA